MLFDEYRLGIDEELVTLLGKYSSVSLSTPSHFLQTSFLVCLSPQKTKDANITFTFLNFLSLVLHQNTDLAL